MLRKIEQSDRAEFLRMMTDFYTTPAAEEPVNKDHYPGTFEAIVNGNPLVDGFMVVKDEVSIGYVFICKSYSNEVGGTVIWLEHLYIEEKYQGNGYGGIVMKEIEEIYKDEASGFRLEVARDNKELMKFYRRYGYDDRGYYQMHTFKL